MGKLSVTVCQRSDEARLSDVACSLGRRDRPYPETHERAFTIALVRRGSFRYRASSTNRSHLLRAGWLLFGASNAEFECSHDHDGGDDCTSLAMSEGLLDEVSRAAGLNAAKLFAVAPALPPLPRVTMLLERARRRERLDLDELSCLVAESVVARAAGTPLPQPVHHASHQRRMYDAMERIEASCRESLSLAQLAADAGFSPFHFVRLFRQVAGTTPHQYLIGARLRLAARMLLDSQRSVTEIAYEVGFNDLSNFMRSFRRVSGQTPCAYRRG